MRNAEEIERELVQKYSEQVRLQNKEFFERNEREREKRKLERVNIQALKEKIYANYEKSTQMQFKSAFYAGAEADDELYALPASQRLLKDSSCRAELLSADHMVIALRVSSETRGSAIKSRRAGHIMGGDYDGAFDGAFVSAQKDEGAREAPFLIETIRKGEGHARTGGIYS